LTDYSIWIKDASIVDGSGSSSYRGSIAVRDDRVVSVGDVEGDAERVIDASGFTAVPGFIDSHSHGDMNLLFFPQCESYVHQGVTTFVGGQCGMSLAPIDDLITLPGIARDYIQEIEPYKYYPERTLLPREEVNEVMEERFGWTVDWHSMGEWFERIEDKGVSMNVAPLVGHNTIRFNVLGNDFKRESTKEEKEEMGELVRQSMEDGCIGMSIGLDYDPSVFADKEELVHHLKILDEYDGIFCPHSRRTGRRREMTAGHRQHEKIDGILEVIELCRASGVKMNIAHLFTGWYVRPQGYPHILEEANREATLQVVDDAISEGLDISFDVIPTVLPHRFGGWVYLSALLEPWLRERGSREELAEWLKVPDYREEIKEAIRAGKWFIRVRYNPNLNPRWADNITVLKHSNDEALGKSVAEIAEDREEDPFDTWLDLIAEDPHSKAGIASVYPSGTVDPDAPYHDIFFQHPESCVGVDTGINDYEWEQKVPPWRVPNINTFSAFIGFFEKFVNKEDSLTLEEAVHKTSTQAAVRHGLEGRGVITEGGYADIVLMDLSNMRIKADPLHPKRKPQGIEYVIVNGTPVIEEGEHTGAKPGRVLKRT